MQTLTLRGDVHVEQKDGTTPLILALKEKREDVAELIIASPVRPTTPTQLGHACIPSLWPYAPVHSCRSASELIQSLLADHPSPHQKINLHLPDKSNGMYPIHLAIIYGLATCVRRIIDKPNCNLEVRH